MMNSLDSLKDQVHNYFGEGSLRKKLDPPKNIELVDKSCTINPKNKAKKELIDKLMTKISNL